MSSTYARSAGAGCDDDWMRIRSTRDSVAMGDDVDAPHEQVLDVADGTTFGDVVDHVLASGYLARIAGGEATWLVVVERVHAVVAQQWSTASWLTDPQSQAPDSIHFQYLAQRDPREVLAVMIGAAR
ncbi:hypothetical protein [Catellatospora sichuanensis]|uniref:hypothetical protein n=1 Tax=Catellatospora sichuanensis TaxID=1969805 RepID=UPI001182F3C8|nr:hypothetical protein [Catellatospora sichuanensis]